MVQTMRSFHVLSFCFISLIFVSIQSVFASEAQNYGVYIVYTGAAASSFHFDHIMSCSSMESWKHRIIHTYDNGFSGFAARLSDIEAKLIAQRPEVISVFPDRVHRLHTTRSWDFLKIQTHVGSKPVQNPISNGSSVSGEDVIIGIFDAGIWPEAKSFNDEGLGPIPSKWKGKCIPGRDFKPFNCNRKLIGARNYVSNQNSPRDHDGHGTHVAAIAAGRPVPGASYHGLAQGTLQGGAPGARIAVYRVCNDVDCWSSDLLKALDDSIADGVDIISLSFNNYEYDSYATDPISIGTYHAAENGILVIAAAGNGGTDEEPPRVGNVAPWILTVGATTTDRFFESDIVLGNNKVIKGGGVHTSNFKKSPVYPLTSGRSAVKSGESANDASNCYRDALDANKVKGKIVLCEYSSHETTPDGQYEDIQSLGGIGLIYLDAYEQLADSISGSIPRIAVTWDDAAQIGAYINSTRNPAVTILPTVEVSNFKPAPRVAFFSGYGPVYKNEYLIKPDIVAPGVDILSAWPSNVTNEAFYLMSGTSISCTYVTGIAALVKSQYPSWGPTAIKSAIMTTANPTNNLNKPITRTGEDLATPYDMGAGEVTIAGSLQPGLVYETKVVEYLRFWCYRGYNESTIKLISSKLPANFSCPKNSKEEIISNLNYPSIAIVQSEDQKPITVKRTVTNVGDDESTYRVSVETSQKFEIKINPTELKFTKNQKKLSYEVIVPYASLSTGGRYAYGSITWYNEKHSVRIPLIVA